jgi:hypothetical protein
VDGFAFALEFGFEFEFEFGWRSWFRLACLDKGKLKRDLTMVSPRVGKMND